MNHARHWSRHDLEYLRLNSRKLTDYEIGEQLGRTPTAIAEMRAQLQIRRTTGAPAIWTGMMAVRLTQMIEEGKRHVDIADELGCSDGTVNKYAKLIRENAGQGYVRYDYADMIMPAWTKGGGVPVRTAHEFVKGIDGVIPKLKALSRRRGEIVAAMSIHAMQRQDVTHNPYHREWMKLHAAYRDVRVAIDEIGRGAWPVKEEVPDDVKPVRIYKKPGGVECKAWSKYEIQYLIDHHQSHSYQQMSDVLGRSVAAISNKLPRVRMHGKA